MKQIFWMKLFITIVVVSSLSLSSMIQPCGGTGVLCSPSTFGRVGFKNKDGALQFPVFHSKHPCLLLPGSSSSSAGSGNSTAIIHPAAAYSVPKASPVVTNDAIHEGKVFMVISLGTPAVFNLVTIDTGSTLSWVQCRSCQIKCRMGMPEVGPRFDDGNSSTYQRVGCSSKDCAAIHESLGVFSGCVEETDICLYSLRYGSGLLVQYSVGKLGRDRLRLGLTDDGGVIDGFVFGCSDDLELNGREAGIVGFGNEAFSFVNQVLAAQRQQGRNGGGGYSYNAFSYCFPGSHDAEAEGFLSIGPYARNNDDDAKAAKLKFTNLIFGYAGDDRRRFVYSLQQLDMMVDGQRLDVDPSVYTMQMMIVDSGTAVTYLLAPVFDALDKAVTAAMAGKGYGRARHQVDKESKVCFWVPGETVDWSDLPTVEMKFTAGTSLKLPPQNVFDQRFVDSDGQLLCLPFQATADGVNGIQILGNKATRSFRVVFDLEARMFGFQPNAC